MSGAQKMQQIPIIDMSISDEEVLTKTWGECMEKIGFAILINHGVPDEAIKNMRYETTT